MPGISGLELSEELQKNNNDILVFIVTSYQDYLDDAFKIHVFRYLSKPINHERFNKNFSQAIAAYKEISKYIIIEEKGDFHYVQTKDILYIENLKYGSVIHTNIDSYTTTKKPKEWLKLIDQPQFFIFSHTSYTVNLQNVVDFDKQEVTLKKSNGEIIKTYMSRRKYHCFKEAFLNFAGGGVTDYARFILSVCLYFRAVGILYLLYKQVRKTLENRLYFNMLCFLFCCAVFT